MLERKQRMKHASFPDIVSLRARRIGHIVQIAILPARSLTHNHIHTWCISHSNPMNYMGQNRRLNSRIAFTNLLSTLF